MNCEHLLSQYAIMSPTEMIKAYNKSSNDLAEYFKAITRLNTTIMNFNAETFGRNIAAFLQSLSPVEK